MRKEYRLFQQVLMIVALVVLSGGCQKGVSKPKAGNATQPKHELTIEELIAEVNTPENLAKAEKHNKETREAAERGDKDAQFELGSYYYVVGEDKEEAARWLRKSAEQGHITAQHLLANAYSDGQGVTRDDTEAAKWLLKSCNAPQ